MTWTIRIPHRDRTESLIDTASHCRHLGGDESAVVRRIVLDAAVDGLRTAGDLIDRIEALEPHERRTLIDKARADTGLPSTDDVEAVERSRLASKAGAVMAGVESPFQLCHAKGCNAVPVNSLGVPVAARVRRWHCPEHIGEAQPGDMDPPPSPWRYAPGGAIVPNDPADDARADAQADSSSRQHAAVLADREHEAAELRATEQARRAQVARELPEHLKGAA